MNNGLRRKMGWRRFPKESGFASQLDAYHLPFMVREPSTAFAILTKQPGFRERPMSVGRTNWDFQGFGCLTVVKAYEVAQLGHFGFGRMFFGQSIEKLVHDHNLIRCAAR